MASPGTEDRTYILSVNIQEGKQFGPDVQAIACAATFAGETKLTPYSIGRDTHTWNTTLQWRVTMDQFRRLTTLGQKDCKVVLANKEGVKLGWFLVDVRAAKLQAQYKKGDGTWITLTGAKKGDSPQVCMLALFYEDRPGAFSSPEPKQSPSKSRASRKQPTRLAATDGEIPVADDPPIAAPASPGADAAQPGAPTTATAVPSGRRGVGPAGVPVAATPPAPNPTAGLPSFGSPGRNPADDGPFRHFALTLDVRTFQSSKRLPLSSASVYAQAVLPAEIIELVVSSGFRLPSRLAPLCSHPAVDIPRGAESALPNGYGTVEFSAGLVQLARVLAREPRISVEAWHKERFRADMLLGAGSVPLSPLLQGAWVDGYAPLFAMVATMVGGEVREERVQVGMLRVVLSLEDKGPAPPPGSQPPAMQPPATAQLLPDKAAPEPLTLAARPSPYDQAAVATAGGGAAEPPAELSLREMHPPPPPQSSQPSQQLADPSVAVSQQTQHQVPLPQPHHMAPPPALSLPPPPALAGRTTRPKLPASAAAALQPPGGLEAAAPEFEAAWELEVWKKAEESRWRSELREREAQRMLVLESEWRRRERAREAEIAAMKAEYLVLEEKAQQVLAAAEGRERRILAAEEALLRRRKELEREHSARMVEAEAAVRRLQVECEHQLDIERDRNAELVRRVTMLEERLAASELRCLNVENEFADFRAAARSTPEAELARQLAEARETAKAAEARAAKAAKAKQGYKEQVRKLAEQLASLQRRRHRDDEYGTLRDAPLGASMPAFGTTSLAPLLTAANVPTIRAAAEEQARFAASQQQELAAMRAQLQAIKAAALAQLSPSSSPRVGASSGSEGRLVAAGRALDETADLRSVDQHRQGRPEWRAGAKAPAPNVAPAPAAAQPARSGGDASRAGGGTLGPGAASAAQQHGNQQPHPPVLRPDETPMHPTSRHTLGSSGSTAAAAGRQSPPARTNGPEEHESGAGRWGRPRTAVSAPASRQDVTPREFPHGPAASAPLAAPAGSSASTAHGPDRPGAPPHQLNPQWVQPREYASRGERFGPGMGELEPFSPGGPGGGGARVPNATQVQHRQDRQQTATPSGPQSGGIAAHWGHQEQPRCGEEGWRMGAAGGGGHSQQQPVVRRAQVVSASGVPHAGGASGAEDGGRRTLADHLASVSAGVRLREREREMLPEPADGRRRSEPRDAREDRADGGGGEGAYSSENSRPGGSAVAGGGGRRGGASGAAPVGGPGDGKALQGGGAALERRRWDAAVHRSVAIQHEEGEGGDEGYPDQDVDQDHEHGEYYGHDRGPHYQHVYVQQGVGTLASPLSGGDGGSGSGDGDGGAEAHADLAEMQRLMRRKRELLQQGYGLEHEAVELLDERIRALMGGS